MRYACDDLNAFDLHDARMLETALEGRDLLWTLKDGNALPQCPVNPHGRAMRVSKLLLRLREYAVLHMEVWNVERRDPNSGMRQLLPQGLPPEVWQDALLGAGEVLSRRRARGSGRFAGGTRLFHQGRLPYQEATLACAGVLLEWDAFSALAWFEERRAPAGND